MNTIGNPYVSMHRLERRVRRRVYREIALLVAVFALLTVCMHLAVRELGA